MLSVLYQENEKNLTVEMKNLFIPGMFIKVINMWRTRLSNVKKSLYSAILISR